MTTTHDFLCGVSDCAPCAQALLGYELGIAEMVESAGHKQDSCGCRSCGLLRDLRLRVRALPPCACGCS